MKILAIGDFHGKFPIKLLNKIKKENFDLIVSPGDFCGNKELGKLFFKYSYGNDNELWEFVGKKKVNELEKSNFNSGIEILKVLKRFEKPIIAVRGNWDPMDWNDIGFSKRKDPYIRKFNSFVKKSRIKIIDFDNTKFNGINFIGYPRSTYPGMVNKRMIQMLKKRNKNNVLKRINKIKLDNKKYFNLFKNKFSENTIFVSHNCPYNTKLDKIKKGIQKGKHYGSWLARKITNELKPRLIICGHMHENQGMQKIGKSLVVNTGAAYEGKAALIEIDEDMNKIIINFIR